MSYTGLLNKNWEGCGKVKPQYQAVSIWEIMEIRTLIGGLRVPTPPSPPPDGDKDPGETETEGED